MVFGVPSGRSAMSLTSGASARGSVRRITADEPRGGQGTPAVSQPVNAGWLAANVGSIVTRPVRDVPVDQNGRRSRSK